MHRAKGVKYEKYLGECLKIQEWMLQPILHVGKNKVTVIYEGHEEIKPPFIVPAI
jgi:hypothetical protein